MRICYLCQDAGIPLDGTKGAAAHVRSLVGAFRDSGHDVLIVSPGASEIDGIKVSVPLIGVVTPPKGQKKMYRALRHVWLNVAIENAMSQVLMNERPDLIYERYSPFAVAGGIVASKMGIPHVLEVNSPLAREGKQYRGQALPEVADTLELMAFENAGLIITVSSELREELIRNGVQPGKIHVVPNGVDPRMFTPEGEIYKQGFGEKFTLGFVGSLKPWHGIETMIEAFQSLAQDPDIHLLVVGDGPMAEQLETLREEYPEQVHLVRAVPHDEVPCYVRAMDIALAPYPFIKDFYFSPLKILEYMSAGRATVASNIGQISELLVNRETGILVPPGDTKALTDAIMMLKEDDQLRVSLGVQAAKEVREKHSWSQRSSEILDLAKSKIFKI